MSEEPRYHHESCDHCQFLGYHQEYDLWACKPYFFWSYNQDGRYGTGISDIGRDPIITEAARRAVTREILDGSRILPGSDGLTLSQAIAKLDRQKMLF